MTTASIVEDIIKAVDENPMALEALRSRLLTRELLESPARLAQLAESHAQLAESHARFEETTRDFIVTTKEFIATAKEFMATTREFIAATKEFMAVTNERLDKLETTLQLFMTATNERFDKLESLVMSIHHDVGVFKGHYARDLAEKMDFTIADEHGFDLERVLSKSEIRAMIRSSDTSDIPRNDLRSFAAADLIMLVTDADGADCYIAVEASYTVHWGDVERAIRNAEFVARFTQRPAHPLVVGVKVNDRVMKFAIETGKALWSRLPDRLIQAD